MYVLLSDITVSLTNFHTILLVDEDVTIWGHPYEVAHTHLSLSVRIYPSVSGHITFNPVAHDGFPELLNHTLVLYAWQAQ